MPHLALRPCAQPGCPHLVNRGVRFCDEHKKADRKSHDKQRGSAASRGYDSRHQRLRKWKLKRNPICEECGEYAATVVHHIIPISVDPRKRLVMDNVQALCRDCHERVERERGKRW